MVVGNFGLYLKIRKLPDLNLLIMRLFLFIAFSFLLSSSSIAQLDFVGSYDTPARLIYLSDNEPAIMIYHQSAELLELYNTDLTLISSIDIPIEYVGSGQYNLFHPSRTLFDCDSTNIEYLISYGSMNISEAYVKIIRDDGTVIFDLPEHTFADETIISANPTYGASMVEDEQGVVFAFFNDGFPSGPTSLYRSCGSIPGNCRPCNINGFSVGENGISPPLNDYLLYPNPGNNQFAIEYDLEDTYSEARLTLVNMNGQVVLEKKVGPSMNYILVNTSNLASGRYQVVLSAEEGVLISTAYIEVD